MSNRFSSKNAGAIVLDQREQLELATALIAAHALYQLPVFRAARDGLIHLVAPGRDATIPKRILDETRRPVVVLIGDDGHASTGPEGWRCAKRLRYWARGGIVHAAGGEPQCYALAVAGALALQRFVLVETDSAHEAAWTHLLRPHMGLLAIRAPARSRHPRVPTSAELN